jgi:hypothetical protein
MTSLFLSVANAWGELHWSIQLLLLAALFVGAAVCIEAPAPRWQGWALVGATGLAIALCMSAGRVAFLHASWAMLGVALCILIIGRVAKLPLIGMVAVLALFVAAAGSVGSLFNDAAKELLHVAPAAAQLALVLISSVLVAPCVVWGLTHRAAAQPAELEAEKP